MVVKLYLINVSAQQYSYWRVEMCMITSINNVKQITQYTQRNLMCIATTYNIVKFRCNRSNRYVTIASYYIYLTPYCHTF